MNDFESKVLNNITVEAILKSIIEETSKWNFKPTDYIKLVNSLMDLSLDKTPPKISTDKMNIKRKKAKLSLPLRSEQISVQVY